MRPRNPLLRLGLAGPACSLLAVAIGFAEPPADAASAPPPVEASTAPAAGESTRVTYLAGPSVYVEAGRAEGLATGDTLSVVRDGEIIARLRVAYLSTHRASCDTLSVISDPQIGDLVRFTAPPSTPPPAAPAVSSAATGVSSTPAEGTTPAMALGSLSTGQPRPSRPALRGRVGARYIGAQSRTAGSLGEVGLDLRLDGDDLGSRPLDLAVDIRSRRTSHTTAQGSVAPSSLTRIYRLSASVHGRESNRRITVGRQSSTALGSMSLFDGVLAELGGQRWTAGLFTGMQPEAGGLALSSQIMEYGAFGEWRQPPGAVRRWSLVGGAMASYDSGQLNRDFLFLQAYYRDNRHTVSLAEEIDVNYGWKREAGEPALSFTNTFLSARTQISPAVAIQGGYDNRRNVRLYRDRDTPTTEFDDRYRQGAWAGADSRFGQHLSLGADVRVHGDGSDAGRGRSWSVRASAARLLPFRARAGARLSRFLGDRTESQLLAGTLGLDPARAIHLELGGGLRETVDRVSASNEQEIWESADLDWTLGRRFLVSAGIERIHGDIERRIEEQIGLSWRF